MLVVILSANQLRILSNHIEQWRSKELHGQWSNLMEELATDSFHWLKNAL